MLSLRMEWNFTSKIYEIKHTTLEWMFIVETCAVNKSNITWYII